MTIPRDPQDFIKLCEQSTWEQLEHMQVELTLAIANMQTQLDDCDYRQLADIDDGWADWKHKAQIALRFAQWRLDTARRIQALKKQHTQCANAQAFQEAARALLQPDTYKMLLEEATALEK